MEKDEKIKEMIKEIQEDLAEHETNITMLGIGLSSANIRAEKAEEKRDEALLKLTKSEYREDWWRSRFQAQKRMNQKLTERLDTAVEQRDALRYAMVEYVLPLKQLWISLPANTFTAHQWNKVASIYEHISTVLEETEK